VIWVEAGKRCLAEYGKGKVVKRGESLEGRSSNENLQELA